MFNIYTEALLRFFSQVRWNGRNVPVVSACQDRAHSQIKEWLEKERGIKTSRASGEVATPYPFMAVWKEPFETAGELLNPGTHRDLKDIESGYGYAMRHPKSVKAGVDVNIYVKTLQQRDIIEYQFHTLFPMETASVPVDYSNPKWYEPPNQDFAFAKILGKQQLFFRMDSLTDNSSLEEGGLAERSLRLTFNGELYGWIPFQPYAVPLVYTTHFAIVDAKSNEQVSEVVYDNEEQ